jgi:hypothetical protein
MTTAQTPSEADLLDTIFEQIGSDPAVSGTYWGTMAVIAEVVPGEAELSAFLYADDDPPQMIPLSSKTLLSDFRRLQEASLAATGEQWQTCIVRIDRDLGDAVVEFIAPEDAPGWHVSPSTYREVGEAARPQPSDFDGG